jgi:hypothetical protein
MGRARRTRFYRINVDEDVALATVLSWGHTVEVTDPPTLRPMLGCP